MDRSEERGRKQSNALENERTFSAFVHVSQETSRKSETSAARSMKTARALETIAEEIEFSILEPPRYLALHPRVHARVRHAPFTPFKRSILSLRLLSARSI